MGLCVCVGEYGYESAGLAVYACDREAIREMKSLCLCLGIFFHLFRVQVALGCGTHFQKSALWSFRILNLAASCFLRNSTCEHVLRRAQPPPHPLHYLPTSPSRRSRHYIYHHTVEK